MAASGAENAPCFLKWLQACEGEKCYRPSFPPDGFWHHLVRDFAIACFISAIVTLLYEAYFRWLIDVKKIDSVLNAVYGSYVPQKVWGNIRDTLTKRDVIRNSTHVRLRVFPAQAEGWLALEIEQTYNPVALYHKEKEVTILHEVDADIAPPGEAPRFEPLMTTSPSIFASNAESTGIAQGFITWCNQIWLTV